MRSIQEATRFMLQRTCPQNITTFKYSVQSDLRRSAAQRLPALLFFALTALTCLWVLSLPVFPAQDAPLHRYYVHIFSELLSHQNTPYTALYTVRHWLPPYATYYYGLVALGHWVSLETADKIFVTLSIFLFAVSGWLLLRTVAPRSTWAPFLLLPVLLNWPTFMGFANYMLSVDLACLAIVAWLRATRQSASRRSSARFFALFLAAILLIVVTHPLPWLFALSFVSLELILRLRTHLQLQKLRSQIVVLALACLPYLYLSHFRAPTRFIQERRMDPKTHHWQSVLPPTFLQRLHGQGFNLLHMQGVVLFLGHGPARPYRLALNAILWGAFLLALWTIFRPRFTRQFGVPSARHLTRVWFVYGCALAVAILLIPDNFAGGYFFTSRLQLLVYVAFLAAAAQALETLPRFARGAAMFSAASSLFALGLAIKYVTPAAQVVLSARQITPVNSIAKPGLLLRPVGVAFPAHLNFDSYNWAPADYFRLHETPMYNTPWLGEPLIPLRLTARGQALLDDSFFNQAPQYGEQPMLNQMRAESLLRHASYVVMQRESIKRSQNPFAIQGGAPAPASYAQGWTCSSQADKHWFLCLPPNASFARQATSDWPVKR